MKDNILVIGDTIIDHSIFCNPIGISLETPTMKTEFVEEEYTFGGAANVVSNLLSLSAKVTFITANGQDAHKDVLNSWKSENLDLYLIEHSGKNTVKSRYWISKGDNKYKFLQVNRGQQVSLTNEHIQQIKDKINNESFETALLVDYRKGFFNNAKQTQELISLLKERDIKVIASSQISDGKNQYFHFAGSNLICMNETEATNNLKSLYCPSNSFKPVLNQLKELSENLRAGICVTLGSRGSVLYDGNRVIHHGGYPIEAKDSCGAGDSFLAAFAVKYPDFDLEFCNKWAAASTLNMGTKPPTYEDFYALN